MIAQLGPTWWAGPNKLRVLVALPYMTDLKPAATRTQAYISSWHKWIQSLLPGLAVTHPAPYLVTLAPPTDELIPY